MKIKLPIALTLVSLLVLGITGCVPNTPPATTVSTDVDYGEQIEMLTTQVALLNEDLADLKSQVNVLDDINVPDYSSQINNLQSQLNAVQSQLNTLSGTVVTLDSIAALEERLSALESSNNNEEILALQAQIDELEASIGEIDTDGCCELIDELSLEVQTIESAVSGLESRIAPRYAWVSAIGRDTVQVTVSASGNYPVVITFYGSNIMSAGIKVPANVTMYRVLSRLEYGGYYLSTEPFEVNDIYTYSVPVTVTDGTTTMTGTVTIVNRDAAYIVAQNATQVVVVVEPVNTIWAAGDVITLDITGSGNIDYVTASVGMEH